MRYFVFDLETTGLPQRKSFNSYYSFKDFSKFAKARIVSIAWSIYENKHKIMSKYHIIRPNDFEIIDNSIATSINNITNDIAKSKGVDFTNVIEELIIDLENVELLVAHNLKFDKNILLAELHHIGRYDLIQKILLISTFCTMKHGKNITRLHNPRYPKDFKYPKLTELYFHFFGHEFINAHNAEVDVNACAKCYQKIIGIIK